ncbi:hypothetical protein COLO4_02094, partial [Corchorus olitorius]
HVLAQRHGADEAGHGNEQRGFEEDVGGQPDAEQDDDRQDVDIEGVQGQHPIRDVRSLHQAIDVEHGGHAHHPHAQQGH